MPRGPNGEKCPADAIGCAVTVARVTIGEAEETGHKQAGKRGLADGKARAQALTPAR